MMTRCLVLQFCNQEKDCSSHFIITLGTLMTACLILNSPSKDNVGVFSTHSSRKFLQMFELCVVSPCASLGPDSSRGIHHARGQAAQHHCFPPDGGCLSYDQVSTHLLTAGRGGDFFCRRAAGRMSQPWAWCARATLACFGVATSYPDGGKAVAPTGSLWWTLFPRWPCHCGVRWRIFLM